MLGTAQIYDQLIKSKNDQVIIDLSEREKNQIDGLKLSSKSRNDFFMTESGFELIPTYLDVESVKELKIVGYKDTEFPTQIFRPFKNLTRLKIEIHFEIKQYFKENTFIGLESLEILELANQKWTRERIVLKDCTFADFRLEYLELFKSLENLQIFTSRFAKSEIKSFNRFEKLKILETDLEEEMHLKSNLDILSLASRSFKPHISLNALKFLIIRDEFQFNEINFLNQLNQLEFLDLILPNKLADNFNQVNLPKLKFLVLTCRNTPSFNQSLQNLQGLELINAKFTPRDKFINLKSLDYLAITNLARSMLETFCGTTFSTIKNLKFLKIENCFNEFFYDDDKKNKINKKLSELFESPENVLFYDNMCNNESLIECLQLNGEELD
ncbi:hypothetical protein BpHYR1_024732 [Brachionus plicatilis]|uniref:Uncharacterized protein n=1 Tax=Brachionus plicatilis TaxID=10195 RepID=A0A3M7P9Z0_BRAPC|nr:hypothetical protein BpHYR1_024732 [Brachionus plicatilis]